MRSHLVVNNTDYTDHIVPDSYDIYSEDIYESWLDGNKREHRIIVAKKIRGSLQIRCAPGILPLSTFLASWNTATDNGVTTMGIYVPNEDKFSAIEAYCAIKPAQHIKDVGGNLYDVLTIEISER
ncbi:MAG: hypothetical protein J6U56_05260 [Spirochaetia bacterium]|nr:hypothetical protein [Spirochaetia bacterium]